MTVCFEINSGRYFAVSAAAISSAICAVFVFRQCSMSLFWCISQLYRALGKFHGNEWLREGLNLILSKFGVPILKGRPRADFCMEEVEK